MDKTYLLIGGSNVDYIATSRDKLQKRVSNIGEVSMFGVPIVLNPTLVIPFIIAPLVTVIFGYVLTMLHICPIMYVDLPWTMPPLIISFLGSGGNIMGPVCQLLGIILSALVYLPFVKIYEKQQAQLASE